MNLDTFISQTRPLIEKEINTYFTKKISEQPTDSTPHLALTKLYESIYGGKMIRGMMTVLGERITSKTEHSDIYRIAMAMEIVHTALLIHDDIMDDDLKRRGRDTLFYQYQKIGSGKNANDAKLYGQALALCVGDIAFFMAYDILAAFISTPEKLKKIVPLFSEELYKVGYAQMEDVHFGQIDYEPTLDEIIDMYRCKTARYTFTLPFTIGGILGDMNENNLATLQQFGEELGIIFQIRDDELGIFGTEDNIGKAIGSDIRENKKTLLRYLLLKRVSEEEKKRIISIFGNNEVMKEEIEYVRDLIESYKIRDEINKDILARTDKLTDLLSHMSFNDENREILQDLIEYNLKRNT